MKNLDAIVYLLGGFLADLPARWRARVYSGAKWVAGLATLVILALPVLGDLGVEVPDAPLYVAVLTGVVAFLGRLAGLHLSEPPPDGETYGQDRLI